MKRATSFPYGKLTIFRRDIPLKKNGGLNMTYLTIAEREIYRRFLKEKKNKTEQDAMEALKEAYLS